MRLSLRQAALPAGHKNAPGPQKQLVVVVVVERNIDEVAVVASWDSVIIPGNGSRRAGMVHG